MRHVIFSLNEYVMLCYVTYSGTLLRPVCESSFRIATEVLESSHNRNERQIDIVTKLLLRIYQKSHRTTAIKCSQN